MKKNMEKMNLEVVKQYLVQQGVAFRCDDEGYILIDFTDVQFEFRVSDGLIQIDSFIVSLPEEVFRQTVHFMNKANQALPERCLEIVILPERRFESKDELIVWKGYRISSRIEKGTLLQTSQVEEMLDACCRIGAPLITWICNNANRNSGL